MIKSLNEHTNARISAPTPVPTSPESTYSPLGPIFDEASRR